MKILFIGDIVGRAGRRGVRKLLPRIKGQYAIDLIIANGENAAGGFGITKKVADELYEYGIDCITMGNHTWNNKDIFNFIDDEPRLIRPLNYLPDTPGRGWTLIEKGDKKIGVINLVGQLYMQSFNAPLMVFNNHITQIKDVADIIVVDFHAEATGEKLGFANCIDGMVNCVVGTHTHIQTADAQILDKGTAYISDLGFTGAVDSILGMKKEEVKEKFKTKLPGRLSVATGEVQLEGVLVEIVDNYQASDIKTIHLTD